MSFTTRIVLLLKALVIFFLSTSSFAQVNQKTTPLPNSPLSLIKWDNKHLKFTNHFQGMNLTFLLRAQQYSIVSEKLFVMNNDYFLEVKAVEASNHIKKRALKRYNKSVKKFIKSNKAVRHERPDLEKGFILKAYSLTYNNPDYGPSEQFVILIDYPFTAYFYEIKLIFRQQANMSWDDPVVETLLNSIRWYYKSIGVEAQQWQARRNQGEELTVFSKNGLKVSPSNNNFKLLSYGKDNLMWDFYKEDKVHIILCYLYEFHTDYTNNEAEMTSIINEWLRYTYGIPDINANIDFEKTHQVSAMYPTDERKQNNNHRFHLTYCGDKVIGLMLYCNKCDCSDQVQAFERYVSTYRCP